MLPLPSALRAFAEALNNDGVTLYAVGGCVRDAYLGRPVHDIDLCSRLKPDELMRFAGERGIEARIVQQTLGTVLLSIDGQTFEHTTFRTESYGAGGAHRPDSVRFSDSPQIDAMRRDFSVNALYESVADGTLCDPCGGMEDLNRRVLRTTTDDPALILRDDGLRILRLVRFATMLKEVGALPYLLPECLACDGMAQRKDHHKYDVLTHMFHACENTPNELCYRLSALLHDVGKPEAKRRDGNLYAHDLYGERIARTALERLRYPTALYPCCPSAYNHSIKGSSMLTALALP